MASMEEFAVWLLDQGSVCINDDYPSPVTIDFGIAWIEVPLEFHSLVKHIKALSDPIPNPLVNKDGTVNFTKRVSRELQKLGWSGCALDNDCACSDATHERDGKILNKYIKDHK